VLGAIEFLAGSALVVLAGSALVVLAGSALGGQARASAPKPIRSHSTALPTAIAARSWRSLKAHDVARLHYVSASGSILYETGAASGTLPGSMRVHMRLAATFSGSFVIRVHGGSIFGRGRARAHGSGTYESFAGTLTVSGGTGRFKDAHGRAGLYGVFDRRNYSLTVQTMGTLRY
jgi:hypothetical protein